MQKNLGKIKRTVEEYVVLTVATLILVVGVYVFKFPNNFSFGGVTGLAVVLGAVLPTSPGNLTFIINMLLLVLGFIFLGRGFGVKTVYVSVLTSVGLSFAERVFPMDAPLTGQPVLKRGRLPWSSASNCVCCMPCSLTMIFCGWPKKINWEKPCRI